MKDCCDALLYMYEHADELGIDPERIIVGGESAGGGLAAAVCLYAREADYSHLPPCVTFVEDGEPFYAETLAYVANLKKAGIDAKVQVYHGKTHAFDMLLPWTKNAKAAKRWLCRSVENYF